MAGVREAKREALREALIVAATRRVETGGIKELNARTVTKDAGCALGSLYTAFEDLDDLIIHMNSRTLQRLGETIAGASAAMGAEADPVDRLKALARAYVRFAEDNHSLWVALFDYASLTNTTIPQWHQNEQDVLVREIVGPVQALSPDMPAEDVANRVRMLFSAVHGIVSLSLEDRFIGVPRDRLDDELLGFIDQMVAGLGK